MGQPKLWHTIVRSGKVLILKYLKYCVWNCINTNSTEKTSWILQTEWGERLWNVLLEIWKDLVGLKNNNLLKRASLRTVSPSWRWLSKHQVLDFQHLKVGGLDKILVITLKPSPQKWRAWWYVSQNLATLPHKDFFPSLMFFIQACFQAKPNLRKSHTF